MLNGLLRNNKAMLGLLAVCKPNNGILDLTKTHYLAILGVFT